jgi:hypothetical protein
MRRFQNSVLGPEVLAPVRIVELPAEPLADGFISGDDVEVEIPVEVHEDRVVVLIGFEQDVKVRREAVSAGCAGQSVQRWLAR